MSDAQSRWPTESVTARDAAADDQTGSQSNAATSFADLKQAFSALAPPTFSFRCQGATPASIPLAPESAIAGEPLPSSNLTAPLVTPSYNGSTNSVPTPQNDAIPARMVAETPNETNSYATISSTTSPDHDSITGQWDDEKDPELDEISLAQMDMPLEQVLGHDIDLLDEDDEWDWPPAVAAEAEQPILLGRRQVRSIRSRASRETWLYKECIPRLLSINAERGFISLSQLARALQTINNDERLCNALIDALDHDNVRVTRAVAHSREGGVPVADVGAGCQVRRVPG